MKISYNWLCDYLKSDLTEGRDSGVAVAEIAEILTDIGLEVDGVERIEAVEGGLEGVVVGEVLTCTPHPDSDHLNITTVDVGAGTGEDGPLQIVCGAANVAAGQKVLVATIGTALRPRGSEGGLKIKKSKIRGVESMGMICAEDELGVGESHDGIMVLEGPGAGAAKSDRKARPGMPAAEYLDLRGDWMIEIGLTPNRIDGGSHWGVARDLAAYLKTRGRKVELGLPSVEGFAVDNRNLEVAVEVVESKAAPRYAGLTITGLEFGPSPEWLQNYLRTIGLNPHNNLVDITNFILHELGQPLHAFDADKIAGRKVIVRTYPEGTPFTTLDGVERKLSVHDLVICDAEKPMCIAGVMGGQHSGVSETTTSIFLESAYFDPVWIRKTARRHGINSDASFLFERGIDPDITIYALKRAALLFCELAGGVVSSEITDIYPDPVEPFRFEFSLSRAARLIGKNIPRETVLQILAALDVKVENVVDGDVLQVAVPPYRVDVRREADLVEEVLRIYGYNNVEIPSHILTPETHAPRLDKDRLQNVASDFLSASGWTEIMSNSLTRLAYYEGLVAYPARRCVKILNPLSGDLNAMRQTLLFNALEAVQRNTNHRNADLRMYEFGNCYFYDEAKRVSADNGGKGGGAPALDYTGDAERGENGDASKNILAPYSETYRLGMTVTGLETQPSWNARAEKSSFYTLSGAAARLLARFGFSLDGVTGGFSQGSSQGGAQNVLQAEPLENDLFSEAVAYRLNGRELLQMGVVAPKLLSRFDVKAPVYFLEMDFGLLVKAAAKNRIKARELSRFPAVKRDLALLVDRVVTFRELRDIALRAEKKLLKSVTLFDVYEGDKLPAGKKSYALGFVLEDPAATLTDREIDRVMGNLVSQFEKQAGASVRA